MQEESLKKLGKLFCDHNLKKLDEKNNGRIKEKIIWKEACANIDNLFNEGLTKRNWKIDCQRGCSYCCHLKVDVIPIEVFLIVEYMKKTFSDEKQNGIKKKAEENWKKIKTMTLQQQIEAKLECPLLDNGECSIYPVRPTICRLYHSTDVKVCEGAYKNPNLLSNPDKTIPELKETTLYANGGQLAAFKMRKYDVQPYDINAALIESMKQESKAEKRWRDKKNAFPNEMLAKDAPNK